MSLALAETRALEPDIRISGHIRGRCPERNGGVWMKDDIGMFSSPRQNVLDHFANTISIAKAKIFLRGHYHFVGCYIKDICFKDSILGLCKYSRDKY